MKKRMIIVGLATVAVAALANGMTTTDCTVRFRVVDEAGHPVPDAHVRGMSDWAGARQNGLTDTNGVFSYRDRVYSEVGCTVTKEGYYRSQGEVWHWSGAGTYPTNTLTVVLKRVIDPVPMAYRKVSAVFPRLDEPVGFDLEVGDWVEPDGKGKIADAWFRAERRWVSREDFDFKVTAAFSNALDGIQSFTATNPDSLRLASDLMPQNQAPGSEYAASLELSVSRRPNASYQLTKRLIIEATHAAYRVEGVR